MIVDMETFKSAKYRVEGNREIELADFPHQVKPLYRSPKNHKKVLENLREDINELQRMMYAHDRYGLLLIFQALDAAGKDSTIRNVITGVNPHGVSVHAFKRPTEEELDHEFLWRSQKYLPRRGQIAVFNRSYYEEVLIVKVHPEIITKTQRLPQGAMEDLWKGRYQSIREHEAHLVRNGTRVLKFYLHLSRDEQRARFISRIDEAEKNWKFNEGDVKERGFWNDYQRAYEQAINETAMPEAPWYVIPADDKLNARMMVAKIIKEEMEKWHMEYPVVTDERRLELERYREMLVGD